MAKKTVASLRIKTKAYTKIIRAVKTDKGTYAFKEDIIPSDNVKDFLKENVK